MEKRTKEQLEEIRRSLTPSQLIELCHRKAKINERLRQQGKLNEAVEDISSMEDPLTSLMTDEETASLHRVMSILRKAKETNNEHVSDIIVNAFVNTCRQIEEQLDLRDEGHGEDPD